MVELLVGWHPDRGEGHGIQKRPCLLRQTAVRASAYPAAIKLRGCRLTNCPNGRWGHTAPNRVPCEVECSDRPVGTASGEAVLAW